MEDRRTRASVTRCHDRGSADRAAGDDELVAHAQRGCAESFGVIYGRHSERVRRFLQARTRDAQLSQDLTSETFLRAWQGVDGFAGGSVEAWLVRIARNLMVDHFRLARVRHELSVAEVTDDLVVAPDPVSVVLAREESADRQRLVHRLLGELTGAQRRCLVLRFLEGHDIRRTAEVLGRSEGAVKVLQHRATSAARRASAR